MLNGRNLAICRKRLLLQSTPWFNRRWVARLAGRQRQAMVGWTPTERAGKGILHRWRFQHHRNTDDWIWIHPIWPLLRGSRQCINQRGGESLPYLYWIKSYERKTIQSTDCNLDRWKRYLDTYQGDRLKRCQAHCMGKVESHASAGSGNVLAR